MAGVSGRAGDGVSAVGPDWRSKERETRRWIENLGFDVHDANLVFRANCPNIDLIVYGRRGAVYVQTKSSQRPAGNDSVVVDGSPWTEEQLHGGAIFNRHEHHYQAAFVVVADTQKDGVTQFFVAPPGELEQCLRRRGVEHAEKPKRDGSRRSVKFRKELTRADLADWLNAWQQLGEPLR